MQRQIDTAIGMIVGGVFGWYHHSWLIWLTCFGILFLWNYIEKKESKPTKEPKK